MWIVENKRYSNLAKKKINEVQRIMLQYLQMRQLNKNKREQQSNSSRMNQNKFGTKTLVTATEQQQH